MAQIEKAKAEIALNKHTPDSGFVRVDLGIMDSAKTFAFALSEAELSAIRSTIESAMSRALADLVRDTTS